jgi:hypothetical protein
LGQPRHRRKWADLTVVEMLAAFKRHAKHYYGSKAK